MLAISDAAVGVWYGCVQVATMMTSMSWEASPAAARAFSAAAADMVATVSSSLAHRRSMIPERSLIHSSDESMVWQISSLVTTREGR